MYIRVHKQIWVSYNEVNKNNQFETLLQMFGFLTKYHHLRKGRERMVEHWKSNPNKDLIEVSKVQFIGLFGEKALINLQEKNFGDQL